MLENVVAEKLSVGTGEGEEAMDNSVELSADEDSDEDSGDEPFLDVFFGRRVSDVVWDLAVDSGGD